MALNAHTPVGGCSGIHFRERIVANCRGRAGGCGRLTSSTQRCVNSTSSFTSIFAEALLRLFVCCAFFFSCRLVFRHCRRGCGLYELLCPSQLGQHALPKPRRNEQTVADPFFQYPGRYETLGSGLHGVSGGQLCCVRQTNHAPICKRPGTSYSANIDLKSGVFPPGW